MKFRIIALILGALLLIPILENTGHTTDLEKAILNQSKGSIVQLTSPSRLAGGTGFELLAPSGVQVTVTNAHVCGLAEDGVMKASRDGAPDLLLKVVKVADSTDLCVLEGVPDMPPLTLDEHAAIYSRVFAVGHPHLRPTTITEGFIVARKNTEVLDEEHSPEDCSGGGRRVEKVNTFMGPFDVCIRSLDSYFTSIYIYPGNSGSPMVNEYGHVVGVMFASDNDDHMGSAIPLDVLEAFVSTIK